MKKRTSASNASWLPAILILALGVLVFRPFIGPVLWAFIIAYATWPLFIFIRKGLRGRASLSALATTMTVAVVIIGSMIAVAVPLTREVIEVAHRLVAWSGGEPNRLALLVADIPIVGAKLSEWIHEAPAWRNEVATLSNGWLSAIPKAGRLAGRNVLQFGFTIIALYFTYRHGESLVVKADRLLEPLVGPRLEAYVASLQSVTRAVLVGVPITAIGQAAAAGIGYWASGADEPILLTLLTAIAALVPFGAPFIWLPTGVMLLIDGHAWNGIGLLVWGALVVSSIDNVIRMYIIGNAIRMPFALALLSILGGVAAFGLVGLFAGPLVAEMLRRLWDERLEAATRREPVAGNAIVARSLRVERHRPTSAARAMMRRRARRGRVWRASK
ncbi:membrane protein [Caballeronia calidae]|uniref:Membrane protein n=1 Tax=Caballeronia calidae TaxID=1777139 RepID=A0A158CZJ1_9BURK|nr:AI-2E family transporter [Caballeronia calidae]SAK87027.1 membrane protein [Caballeronia calidae]